MLSGYVAWLVWLIVESPGSTTAALRFLLPKEPKLEGYGDLVWSGLGLGAGGAGLLHQSVQFGDLQVCMHMCTQRLHVA